MSAPRVVALAGGPVGTAMLDVLLAHGVRPVAVVVSHAGGGSGRPCPFTVAWCERHGVEHAYFPRLRRQAAPEAFLRGHTPELLLSLSYDLILPEPLLALAPRAVNVHRGIAPDFRGAYSTIWALARGADEVGVTIHEMVGDVDAGSILAQARLPVAPELTAAEAIPLVERTAVELLDAVLDDLLTDRLPRQAQGPGGEVFGRELPPAALVGVEPLVRARFNPPYPGPSLTLGERRFTVVETPPAVAAVPEELTAAPHFVPPAVWHNAGEFARGLDAVWTRTVAEAFALALSGPVALPSSCGPALAAAARGLDTVRYDPGDPDALRHAAAGRTVVLSWTCGRPPSSRTRALAAQHARRVVEDRTGALLSRDPIEGDAAVLDLAAWTGSREGAGVVHRGGLQAPATIDPIAAREALTAFDSAAARLRMERAAARYMTALGAHARFTHWPPATVAHGFPITVEDAATRERIDAALPGLVQRPLDGNPAVLALPCHAGTVDAHVDTVIGAVRAAGVTA